MPDTSPDLAAVIAGAIESRLLDVHTALPGRVESYDPARQVADVKPMLRRVMRRGDMSREAESLPVLPCVPVSWPRGGGGFVSMPLAAGDFGMLVFADYTLDRFRSTGEECDPGDERRFDLSNAVFLPSGPWPSADPIAGADADGVRIGMDVDYVAAVRATGAAFPHDAAEFLARADRVLSELQSVATSLANHTHTAGTLQDSTPAAVTGVTGPSSSTYSAGSVASDTVKGT